ncbi:MAG: magnesium transporter CorA family protein [Anaerolineae bacterium]|nr:magnesium transporter CorA family protein [Anaerolineae bacterium]
MALKTIAHKQIKWLDIRNPTPEEIKAISTLYHFVHPLNIEDMLSPNERPKLDVEDDYIFIVLHFPLWDPIERLSRAREVNFLVMKNAIITIHDGSLKPLTSLIDRCNSDHATLDKLLGKGTENTLYIIIDTLVDYVLPILRKVDSNIQYIEETVFKQNSQNVIREIALVRRDIIALRRIIRQQVPVLNQIADLDHPILPEDSDQYFGDVVDHIEKARDMIDEDTELIINLADTVNTLANHRVNEVIRVLTVISVIMLPLTLISSIYGMNIGLPFESHPNAFMIVSGFMFITAVVMLAVFRFRRWI